MPSQYGLEDEKNKIQIRRDKMRRPPGAYAPKATQDPRPTVTADGEVGWSYASSGT